jgi:hypothetical protein
MLNRLEGLSDMATPAAPAAASQSCISADSPLIFMHNPKTGGMSIFTAFTSLWGTDIADLYDVSRRNLSLAEQAVRDRSKALYCGHYGFGLHDWLDRPAYYASVLREPVSRVVSLYNYCVPILNVHRKRLQQLGGDFAKLSAQPRISDFYLDFEPWLAGEPTAEAFFASPCAELDNGMVRRFSGHGLSPAPCPDSALDLAKQNIEQYFSVVGVLERYPETLQLMADAFGLPALSAHHVNARRNKEKEPPLGEALMEKIRAMNRLDLALYDWVCERFDAQLAKPPAAVLVPAGGRTDYGAMPLWRAVGRSPLREAAMKERGLPKRTRRLQPLLCTRVTGASIGPKVIITDLETAVIRQDQPPAKGPSARLVFEPETAKRMVNALRSAITAFEKQYGKTTSRTARPQGSEGEPGTPPPDDVKIH